MDKQLQDFIGSMQTLSDIRNLDTFNPVIILLQDPSSSDTFVTTASILEPSYIGIPVYATWVVMDPNSPYYLKALKLVDLAAPTASQIPGVITNANFHVSWIELQVYADIFTVPQYYALNIAQGPRGPQGPVGPTGPAGPQGPQGLTPVVDYTFLIDTLVNELMTGIYLDITGPSPIADGSTAAYQVVLHNDLGANQLSGVHIQLVNPPAGVSIDTNNVVTVAPNSITSDTNITLQTSYIYLNTTLTASRIVTISAAQFTGITLSTVGGATSFYEGSVGQLQVMANSGTGSIDVTASATFSSSVPNVISVSSTGAFTVNPNITASSQVTLTATYNANGVEFTSSIVITASYVYPVSVVIQGSTSVNAGTTSGYTATATMSDASTRDITTTTGSTWSLSDVTMGTITNNGVLTAAAVANNITGNVMNAYTFGGVTVNSTLQINVVAAASSIYPYYGVADLSTAKNAALILGLSGRGPIADLVATVTMDSGAPTSTLTMFYAYPSAYGYAQFEDAASPGFYGGWDGALGDPTDPTKWGPMTIQVDMGGGNIVPFYLYQTDYPGLGSVTWNVTHKP